MDYLQTTGDRLHDLELDRILARLSVLEGGAALAAKSTTPVSITPSFVPVAGVRSITPAGGTPLQDDLVLAVIGPAALAQSAHTLTLTVSVSPAGTVTEIGPASVVGTATRFAREDHMHRGVHKITGSADTVGDIVFAGAGVSQAGNTFTFSSGGGGAVSASVLVFSPGGSAVNWTVPATLTEFNGLTIYRAQSDLTNAAQARLILVAPVATSVPFNAPTLAVQYSTNGGAVLNYLDGAAGPSLVFAAGVTASGWITLTGGAKADVLLRIVGAASSGTAACIFGSLYVQAK